MSRDMRLLFTMDSQDYDDTMPRFVRPSVRGIISRDGKIAMVHSLKYDYYKFPGGGMEPGETQQDTLIRETREETGLQVLAPSVRPYGRVYRAQNSGRGDVLIQENYYYLCEASDGEAPQNLDDYEREEAFTLEFVFPQQAIAVNRKAIACQLAEDPVYAAMALREMRVLELLLNENMV